MTPEEKAKELYPDRNSCDLAHERLRKTFTEGANWMSEGKDKEIAELREKCILLQEEIINLRDNPNYNQ